ncbi:hypothetical protein BC834DRAFT_607753 [Gloeopeniophorella convolvens]|nr:hypothetical protein BC834DRAFT_607753 [Gloeopeniophorella convolvens]
MRVVEPALIFTCLSHIACVVAQGFPVPTNISSAQALEFQNEVVQLAQSSNGQAELASDVVNAAGFSSGMVTNFTVIGDLLAVIDSLNLGPVKFQPGWNNISNQFTQLLTLFKKSASLTASIADQMDTTVLPFVLSTDVPNSFKVPALQVFIANITTVASPLSSAISSAFNTWNDNLTSFSNSFASFAAEADPARDTSLILTQLQSLALLTQDLNNFTASTHTLAVATGTNPVVGAGNRMVPTFYSQVTIGAAILAEILPSSSFSLISQYQNLGLKILGLQGMIQSLRNELSLISSARGFINSTATFNRDAFSNHIGFASATGSFALSEINNLIAFLQLGGPQPTVLQVFLTEGTTIYSSVASALNNYAQLLVF